MGKQTANASILLVCALAASWLTLYYGRDIPWDFHNYHAYAAYSLTHDRLAQDFFPAGLPGYANPIGFAPLALIQHWQLSSMTAAVVLASIHSLNAFFLYLICRDMSAGMPWPSRVTIALGWLLGASTPIFLIHLGSTFVDPIGTVLVMASLWVVAFRQSPRWALAAGALVGISMAIKLSNACFAIAIAMTVCLPWRGESLRQWLTRVGAAAIGMLAGFAISQGYWSMRLQETMGNPFFPFFNGIFRSPYMTTESIGAFRFQPRTLADLIALPYELALPKSWVYLEMPAPVPTALLACVLAIALALRYAFRFAVARSAVPVAEHNLRLVAFLFIGVLLWLATSANGRYGMPIFLLLGPLCALASVRILPQRYAVLLLLLALSIQFLSASWGKIPRWGSSNWTPRMTSVDIPRELREHPQLLISLASPSYSEIIPYLHGESSFVNLKGTYSIPSSGPAYARFNALVSRYSGRTQVLFLLPRLEGFIPDVDGLSRYYSASLDRVGLQLKTEQCVPIVVDRQPSLDTHFNRRLGKMIPHVLVSCPAIRSSPNPEIAERRARATSIMDAFERKCPDLFLPSRPQIDGAGEFWTRTYFNYDGVVLAVRFDKDAIFYLLTGQTSSTYLGKASNPEQALERFDCRLPGRGKRGIEFFNENEGNAVW